jgi:transcription elongation factor GreA
MATIDQKFLTQGGYDKLLNELNTLKEEKIPDALRRLKEASEQGDISENAEYDDALSVRDLLEARVSEIERLLDGVEIIQKGKASDTVAYGSVVTFQFTDDKKNYTVSIVGSGEVSIEENQVYISLQSPLGSALKGKKKGETAKIRLLNGDRREAKIISIA